MAWIIESGGQGRWVERKERAELIATYTDYIKAVRLRLEDGHYVSEEDLIEVETLMNEVDRLERIHRCEDDLMEFAIEYLSDFGNPDNNGNWAGFVVKSRKEAAQLHLDLCEIMDEVSTEKRNAKTAVAIARGHGKSTWLSKGFPLRETVFRKRKYLIIISETPSVSGPNLEWIANQLKHNKKLREDFGPLLSEKQQENIRDNSQEFVAWEQRGDSRHALTKVEAASTGQALRGRNWEGNRPDLIICDDLEDGQTNAATPEQREKLRNWFQSVVIPLGDPKGEKTAYVLMGTTVNFDSLLMHILYRRSDFTTRIYRALIEPPIRTDLWEQCREIYQDYDNPDREADALAFYEARKEEMDEGAEVLWEEFQPIWKLMTWRYDNGSKAFQTEYQNNPIDLESAIFNPEAFTYWDDTEPTREFPHKEYTISMGVDVAMGKTDRGDYSAAVTVATHKESGVQYVIDAWGDKVHPDKFIEVITDKVIEFEPDVIGVEAVALQEYFADTLSTYLQARGYPTSRRIKKINNRSRKELRIESMLPDIDTNKLQFNRRHTLLLEQMERFGQGAHDDLPDALQMAISVNKNVRRALRQKPSWI